MDTLSKQARSRLMARIPGAGNKATELECAKLLRRNRITGWRRNQPLAGKPDFLFRQQRVAIFVDGCFWHDCPRHCRVPSSNRPYWFGKISNNKARDLKVTRTLRAAGWRVVRIWEHELPKRGMRNAERGEKRLLAKLRKVLAA